MLVLHALASPFFLGKQGPKLDNRLETPFPALAEMMFQNRLIFLQNCSSSSLAFSS